MSDIFFSYSSKDRERVLRLRDGLVERGFSVFWDQEVPAGTDWDTWIRRYLNNAKCAIVVWSTHSVASDNVRHEATIAKQQNKLVPVMLDSIAADQFPMGLYAVQAANLAAWTGDLDHPEWLKLVNQVETKLTPAWVRRTLDSLEAELIAERARRETSERRDRTLRDQIVKEAQARQTLQAELDGARDQIADLTARLDASIRDRAGDRACIDDVSARLRESENQREELARQQAQSAARISQLEQTASDSDRDAIAARIAVGDTRADAAEARPTELSGRIGQSERSPTAKPVKTRSVFVTRDTPEAATRPVPPSEERARIVSESPDHKRDASALGERPCPSCGQPINRLATRCRYCWEKVS